MASTAALTIRAFEREFGQAPDVLASAPGRVNLIGEHTDYNDGFVLPMAIDRRLYVAMVAAPSPAHRTDHHLLGAVADAFARRHAGARAVRWTVGSQLPEAAGLSSSAALEIAWLRARCALDGLAWDPTVMARIAQEAETKATGVRCGIMDQLASASGRRGHAMLLDCRSLDAAHVAMPAGLAVVVMFTGLRRTLDATAYNERRAACERAVRQLQRIDPAVKALRDATVDLLARADLDDVTRRRARHVIEENARPAAMVDALRSGDGATAGRLMNESHASLRDLHEVSSAQLDIACDTAREHAACFGARLTGAGFGGCAIALVRADATADFIAFAQPRYEARTYQKSEFFVASADDGARVEPLS